jgi:hypothetical protein
LLLGWRGGEQATSDDIPSKTESRDAVRRDLKLIPRPDGGERASDEGPIAVGPRPYEGEVVAAQNVWEVRGDYCRDSNVRPDSESFVMSTSPARSEKRRICSGVAVAAMKSRSG